MSATSHIRPWNIPSLLLYYHWANKCNVHPTRRASVPNSVYLKDPLHCSTYIITSLSWSFTINICDIYIDQFNEVIVYLLQWRGSIKHTEFGTLALRVGCTLYNLYVCMVCILVGKLWSDALPYRSRAGLRKIPNALCCEDHYHWYSPLVY